MSENLSTDILILGSGGAGLMCALHAFWRDPTLDITVVSKGLLGKSGCTRMVQGGYNVVLDPADSLQAHFEDTIAGGAFINDQELAWTLVAEAPRIVRELENRIGCLFDRAPDGHIHQKAFAGQTFDRTIHRGDLTGIEIMARLRDQVLHSGVRVLEETRGIELLTHDARVTGALLLDIRSGEYITVDSGAVVLATGAGPLMYRLAACALEKTSDGLAMAYRAGARLMDMEMVQFHPTGLLVPGSRLSGALLEEGLRGAGARLYNGKGERYMTRYDPAQLERATRDRVSRAGYLEIAAGRGTPNGGVWLDVSPLGAAFVEQNFAGMRERCLRLGVDLAREPVEVSPTAHFNMGGMRIDRDGFTNLEGLFAAGEDAAGVHGANRLGGNGVAESTVFGARVGDAVAQWVRGTGRLSADPAQVESGRRAADKFLDPGAGENVFALRTELGVLMWDEVGIVRDGERLKHALGRIGVLQERAARARTSGGRRYNLAWQQALDLRNLLLASELIARSALLRTESRGAHFRSDFPDKDNENWLKNIYSTRASDGPRLWTEDVALTRLGLSTKETEP